MPPLQHYDLTWTDDQGQNHSNRLFYSFDPITARDLPVVILLHGTSGTLFDMADPGSDDQGKRTPYNYDLVTPMSSAPVDRGWRLYPGVLAWGEKQDPMKPVTDWQDFLATWDIPSVNYAQINNKSSLASDPLPVLELLAVVRSVITTFPTRKIAFLTHSRGGILLRSFLAKHGADSEFSGRFACTCMLAAPNQGTTMANDAITALANLDGALDTMEHDAAIFGAHLHLTSIRDLLNAQLGTAAYHDYRLNSPFLASLAAQEMSRPPLMPLHTFGGTSARLFRAWIELFTLGSQLFQVTRDENGHWQAGFHWFTITRPLNFLLGGTTFWVADSLPSNLLNSIGPEVVTGKGDLLVTDMSSHLPWEIMHHVNPISHVEALWDPTLQSQVRDVIFANPGLYQKARLVPSLAQGEYGLPVIAGKAYTLHIGCTDSVTGQLVAATVTITGFPQGTANQPMNGIIFDPNKTYATSSTHRGNHGANQAICTTFSSTWYPPCTLTAPGYDPAGLVLGPATAPAPPTTCLDLAPNVSAAVGDLMLQYLLQHGGDPLPDANPIEGIDQTTWRSMQGYAAGLRATNAVSLNMLNSTSRLKGGFMQLMQRH